jgi:hypothetical protein
MNCQQCQQKILESLAAGAGVAAAEFAVHLNSCAACRHFYAGQQELFLSIDDGLRSLVNRPVPPSLLPSVRARLDEKSIPYSAALYRWSLTAFAVATILAISVGYSLRRPRATPSASSLQPTALASRNVDTARPVEPPQPQPPAKVATPVQGRHAIPIADTDKTPEVIVLAEERDAFARFVAEVPNEPSVALALTRPAPAASGDAVEIALLKIDSLEVKPLESSATESE